MKYFTQNNESTEVTPDINMSPLIDMVFLLLIFFMVTTVFVQETGVEITRPQATTAETLQKNSLLVAVTREGDIVYARQKHTLETLQHTLRQELEHTQAPVVILADTQAPAGLLVQLVDHCKLAGANHVSVAATP